MLEKLPQVIFDKENHILSRPNGKKLVSVTRFIGRFEPDFDSKSISFFMARKEFRILMGWKKKGDPEPPEEDVLARQAEILAEWDRLRDDAAEHGTGIHTVMENAVAANKSDNWQIRALLEEYNQYYQEIRTEVIVSHPTLNIGGIMDILGLRIGKDGIVDIEDYKTNKRKGIQYFSGKFEDNKVKFYNQFFKPPLQHLENCNYNKFAIQLSMYAFLIEKNLPGTRIGRIGIRWVETEERDGIVEVLNTMYLPVPYMRTTISHLLDTTLALEPDGVEGEDW